MAAEPDVKPRVRIKIDPRSFQVVTDAIPTQYRLRGAVGLHKELICEFWAFKGSRFDDSKWFISLVAPQDIPKGWPPREFQEEIVAAISGQVNHFWEAEKPRLKLVNETPLCPKPSQCRRFVTLSAAAASALIMIKTLKGRKNKSPDSPTP